MSRRITAALVGLVFAACGTAAPIKDDNHDGIADGVQSPNTVSVVAPSKPIGSISGVVTNMKFEALSDATVALTLGTSDGTVTKANTDADGAFAFPGLPAGSSGQLTISKSGFGTVRFATPSIPSAAGNVPLNDGNVNVGSVALVATNSSLKFTYLTSIGLPAKGVKAYLEVTPAGFQYSSSTSYGSALGRMSFEATTDDNGVASFSGLPSIVETARASSGNYAIITTPLDVDGDGKVDYLGSSSSYSGINLLTNPLAPIFLADARASGPLSITASNVESLVSNNVAPLRNGLKAAESINVVFNQPILESSLQITIVAEDCKTAQTVTHTLRGNILSISPTTSWTNGLKYNIAIRATSADGRSNFATGFIGWFYGLDANSPRAPGSGPMFVVKKAAANMTNSNLQSGDDLYLLLDTPVRPLGQAGRAFFNIDLNANGNIGMNAADPGEFGAPFSTGFPISAAETTFDPNGSTFTCGTSTYSSRYRINYGSLPLAGIPLSTAVKVTIPRDDSAATGLQTIWGTTVTGDFTGAMTLVP